MRRVELLLLAAAAGLAGLPLLLPMTPGPAGPFSGSDTQAQAAITAANPHYRPWFAPLWKPPSAEIEGLLFALQAALGAGLLGYYLGLRRGQSQRRSSHQGEPVEPQESICPQMNANKRK